MADLICCDPARNSDLWPHVRDRLKIAIDRTGLSDFDEYEKQVLAGEQLLWLAWSERQIEAVATTHLAKIGHLIVCTLTACEGQERERWLSLLAEIENYARNEKAFCMRVFGRKGWERVLDGYRVEHVVLQKRLD